MDVCSWAVVGIMFQCRSIWSAMTLIAEFTNLSWIFLFNFSVKIGCDHGCSPHSEDCDYSHEVLEVMGYLILRCGWDSVLMWEYLVCNGISCCIYKFVLNFST